MSDHDREFSKLIFDLQGLEVEVDDENKAILLLH